MNGTIEQLCTEHRSLEAQAAQMLAIVANRVPDPAAVAAVRWRMAQELFEHCAREDLVVYEQLIISGDAAAIATAWSYRREHGGLGEMFGRYIADWPVVRVGREWDAFRIATTDIMTRIAGRILSEERELYAHAERVLKRRAA
ncbi:hemerythrin domain-containing protein [Sphingomonas sp. AOB5]|uniref:hemerythrin domain-containing protein n=1 Tax=Sphingomonas sp. AOB5 TaxID=3034017 RepID=UPI0023F794AB|nr:hemerythrin domain-containing protein [Sphingomonas sp. AOB5]MDF7776621.1 hemerythrin domain-containing protein [Sphingomonas sp. AOB5]